MPDDNHPTNSFAKQKEEAHVTNSKEEHILLDDDKEEGSQKSINVHHVDVPVDREAESLFDQHVRPKDH